MARSKGVLVDTKDFERFQKDLQRLSSRQPMEKFYRDCTDELAERLLARLAKETPADTGNLRRGWKKGPAVTLANGCEKIIYNPVEYGTYVEYGHRTRGGRGWVPGKFFLTRSEDMIGQETEVVLSRKLRDYLRRCFG